MEYEPVLLDQYFGDLQTRRPVEHPDIIVLRLIHPGLEVVEVNGKPQVKYPKERDSDRDLTLDDITQLLGYLKEQDYRGIVGDYSGEDYHFSEAHDHCIKLKKKGWAYWFVNMPFWDKDMRYANIKYEEPEQIDRNASSVDEAVEKVLELLKLYTKIL